MTILPNSLAARLLFVTALWTAVALLITGLILSTLFRQNAERNFDGLLLAHVYNLMGAIDVSTTGELEGTPNLGDPRFLAPQSGWYWTVSRADKPNAILLHSASISGEYIAVPTSNDISFDDQFRRSYTVTESNGLTVHRMEAQLLVGEGETLYQVLVGAGRQDLERSIDEFNRILWLSFLMFGLGTVIATYFVIRFGLRPLNKATRALGAVREGEALQVEGNYPMEVTPLVAEINGLINANRSIIERARTQVGNLAHALKTPLAVISNETREGQGAASKTVSEQADVMRNQITTYLNRARIAAQTNVITARTPMAPVTERMLRVMVKLAPNLDWQKNITGDPIFAGEEQDVEEILGNLLENASLHASSAVLLSVRRLSEGAEQNPTLEIRVEDDGDGVSPTQREEILKRGKRLDETVPGSGLGLSIVKDIVDEYDGILNIESSRLGGLCVAIVLPAIAGIKASK